MTSTFVYVTPPECKTYQANSLDLGKLPDATIITIDFNPQTARGLFVDPRNPLLDGNQSVTKTAKQIRGGDRVFVRFIERLGKGKVVVINTGYTVIRGHFHFVQTRDEFQIYSDCKKLVCPNLKNPYLLSVIKDIVKDDKNIPGMVKYLTKEYRGQVVWFDPFNLQGVLADNEGQSVHFHLNNVHNFGFWRSIKSGTKVSVRHTVASSRTTFKHEARGVMILK